ncbi:MAG TPA: response regulator [Polyangiaceae bacterium]|nr:response regulator [Polyangiaceae bacterium]
MTTTLLAVDDSVTMRKVLEITFAGEQFKTVLASNGQEALGLVRSERPALVIIDHTLPDTSGYDLCQEVKRALPGVAVVLLASKQNPYDKARGQASGVDDFVDKPFDTQKLIDKVVQTLREPRAAVPVAAVAAAPVAAAPLASPVVAARPRSQTLAYGTAAPQSAAAASPPAPAVSPARTLTGNVSPVRPVAAARPVPVSPVAPVAAAPVAAAPAVSPARPAPAAAPAIPMNGLSGKLEALGLTSDQVQAVLALSREVVEQVVWEVVPVLAETMIKEELQRLTSE